ncbi:MAG: cold-shock protein [Candidatus Buchananbacteria bacterium CG10_big_fil_rev_8_21_14_0_10_42_9]|uniref:Cold-shock protein n=1 Tax=Candidatus Buchananbacteria bacterium CG10_big_fil_rev_8_21_14_0_10_42_9 TaxID=1974526 RepID=A0A2H0W0S1_9BACT|nr:MAG: cold-shock protein [Candidatus Buchananbacteria bacterium CG10_big_fil_rev_8_21_14_0_10_42_9]
MQGTIKKIVDGKNFGFISQGGDKDVFFHADKLNGVGFDELKEGDSVTYDVEQTDKGPAATNVQKA